MRTKRTSKIIHLFVLSIFLFAGSTVYGDDTCIFSVTADDVPPYIVLLLDNGAEMEQIIWHEDYDSATDYSVVGSVFTNPAGYAVKLSGLSYYLDPIQDDLNLSGSGIVADSNKIPTWTINGRTITLPAIPSASVDANGVKDNATQFRYSTNYLNWLFYSGKYVGNGSDLPTKSRFYFAKLAIMKVAKMTANQAKFGIYNFTSNTTGASSVQPLGMVVDEPLADDAANNVLDSSFVNNVNNMGTVTYSPLAEGLASVGGYFASNSSHVVDEYCSKLFSLVISPGVSSMDRFVAAGSSIASFSDFDSDGERSTLTISGNTHTIPTNLNGTTYLDDVAAYHYDHDIVGYSSGFQRINTYTLGFMGDDASNAFLANASNNGNGNFNLYDSTDPDYGKYHYTADDPNNLADELLAAINDILENTSTFTAPVVPVTRTTSGDRIYMALFKPNAGNFWEGNLAKFGIGSDSNGEPIIVDSSNPPTPATWPNGALKETAIPYWETQDWADPTKPNYVHNRSRKIYSYFGSTESIVSPLNEFSGNNSGTLSKHLDNPTDITVNGTTVNGIDKVIEYIRGADVLDEDDDNDTSENRSVITGDILHSEPAVISYSSESVIFFGANDGMLHAVRDSDGSEMWGFIPPDLLPRLKYILEGSGHQYYVDSSPKVFISGNNNSVVEAGEQAILVFGERSGGSRYWALDVTDPDTPEILWSIGPSFDLNLGETWSEPVFTRVKTSDDDSTGMDVMIVGGGYSADDSAGALLTMIDVFTGAVVKNFENFDMDFSIPSTVNAVDLDSNGFVDKVYVGDMGGQMIRIGCFTEDDGTTPLEFPKTNENINDWEAVVLFDTADTRKIFYPPSVTLERGFDLVFFGTGDREDPCDPATSDRIYSVMDDHSNNTIDDFSLVDITDPTANPPDFYNDKGYFLDLMPGEKVLAEGMVFNKVFYISSFDPNNADPCLPGGISRLYALEYQTGQAAIDFNGDGNEERSIEIGGGIPSKPVMIIPPEGPAKLLISVGSTNADAGSEEVSAGIVTIDPLLPLRNFFYLWWQDL